MSIVSERASGRASDVHDIRARAFSIYRIQAHRQDMASLEYRQAIRDGHSVGGLLRCNLSRLAATGRKIEFVLVIFRECSIPCALLAALSIHRVQ